LKEAFENRFGVEITEDEIVRYAKVQDKINKKMREFYRLRFKKSRFYGSDAIAIMVARESLPSEAFLPLLESAMAEKKKVEYRAKVLLAGSPLDEIELIRKIEEMGALIVAETTCFGGGSFWNMAEYDGSEIYEFLASKYLNNLKICARMFGEYAYRKNFIKTIAEEAEVDGVILQHNKFCDLFGIENAKLRIDLEREGLPTLVLEKEYASTADIGRIKTRVQAFLERLKR
jgi:benzoyl-CoA reductase/2-hydroxyglutaryl-CoA dehydratase subunit BcrC/BadD/HgdB